MVRGHRVSAIVSMSSSGIVDFHTTTSSVNADKFKHFVEDALVPHLQPFNGINAHSVVVLDNASIHRGRGCGHHPEHRCTGPVPSTLQP